MEFIKLNNGVLMPQVGLGTYLIPEDKLEETIVQAYELGYRKFDTAWRYYNERHISEILKKNGIKREDIFITTKVNIDALFLGGYNVRKHGLLNIRNFKSVQKVIQESFDNLEFDYIDLFLVHWPWPIPLAQRMYVELTKLYQVGRIRAIGTCSSLPPHLQALADVSEVVPAVNQFEISPLNTQKKLIAFCQERGITVEAMSTFSHFRSNEPRLEILENPKLMAIASAHNKSVVQVVLRWLKQQGISLIPKTWNIEYLKQNIDIFDFELTEEEIAEIDSMDGGKFLNYKPYATLTYPNTTFGRVPKKYRGWKGFE